MIRIHSLYQCIRVHIARSDWCHFSYFALLRLSIDGMTTRCKLYAMTNCSQKIIFQSPYLNSYCIVSAEFPIIERWHGKIVIPVALVVL